MKKAAAGTGFMNHPNGRTLRRIFRLDVILDELVDGIRQDEAVEHVDYLRAGQSVNQPVSLAGEDHERQDHNGGLVKQRRCKEPAPILDDLRGKFVLGRCDDDPVSASLEPANQAGGKLTMFQLVFAEITIVGPAPIGWLTTASACDSCTHCPSAAACKIAASLASPALWSAGAIQYCCTDASSWLFYGPCLMLGKPKWLWRIDESERIPLKGGQMGLKKPQLVRFVVTGGVQ